MKIEVVHPLAEYRHSIWATLLVNDEYLIELTYTVFRSTRITLREPGDVGLLCNWCTGPDKIWTLAFLNVLLGYVEKDKTMPFCSEVKPAFNDSEFMEKVLPYLGEIYFKDVSQLLATSETKKTADEIDNQVLLKVK